MMSLENVEVVRRLFDAFNRLDAETARELWSADGEWRPAYAGGGLVDGAVYRGPDGLAEFFDLQAETWESIAVDPYDIRDLGDQVLAEVRLRAIGRVSGIPVDRVTWNVFEVRDGKVVAGRVYVTKAEALEAVGLPE